MQLPVRDLAVGGGVDEIKELVDLLIGKMDRAHASARSGAGARSGTERRAHASAKLVSIERAVGVRVELAEHVHDAPQVRSQRAPQTRAIEARALHRRTRRKARFRLVE